MSDLDEARTSSPWRCAYCSATNSADIRWCGGCGSYYTPLPGDLAVETKNWTLSVMIRSYTNDDHGRGMMATEARELGQHGYELVAQSEDGGHIHAGRLIFTGGLSIFAGKAGIRSDGQLTVTYRLTPIAPPVPSPVHARSLSARLAQLDEARAAGLVSDEEYSAKRERILADL